MSDIRSGSHGIAASRPDVRSLLKMYWPLAALAVAAALVAVLAHHLLFPAYSWNRDEPVYVWQVHALRQGTIRATDGGAPGLLRPWLSGADHGVIFSHFPVGFPLVLLAGDVVFGSPAAGLAVACILAVLGTYALARELTGDHVLSLVAAGVMVASPILAIQGGVYLGYIFTLGLGLLFSAALLSGVRRALPGRLVVAGALLGYILLSRPFDAVLWALAAGGYLAFVRRREWRVLLRGTRWVALGFLPLVVVTLVFNRLATGSFTQFPNTASDPLDKFGFGVRRIMPGFAKFYYNGREAVIGTLKNAFWTPLFLAGSYLGVVAAAAGLWLRRRDVTTIALLVFGAVFPVGYFFFWGTSVSALTARLSGPIYFVPLYAPLSILIATSLVAAWRRRRTFGMVVLAVLVLATVPAAVNRFAVNRRLSVVQIPWRKSAKSVHGRALVFVAGTGRYLLYLNPYSANDPELHNRLLYAADRGAADLDLIAKLPDRTPYLQRASIPTPELGPDTFPRTPTISLTPIRIVRGKGIALRVRITNPKRRGTLGAYIKVGKVVHWRILTTHATPGATYQVDWRVGIPDTTGSSDPSIVSLTDRLGSVTVGVGYGSSPEQARNRPSLKEIFPYRLHASTIEMLVPPVEARSVPNKQKAKRGSKRKVPRHIWKLVQHIDELDVTTTPTSGTAGTAPGVG